jgi:hypothetical protein
MKKPNNVTEALNSVHTLLSAAGSDLEMYLRHPKEYVPEYFEAVKDVVLDAHMLVTWIKDNLK